MGELLSTTGDVDGYRRKASTRLLDEGKAKVPPVLGEPSELQLVFLLAYLRQGQ
jgi:hypothetical protein